MPGVREFRTPLIAGLLWFAVGWLWLGHRVEASSSWARFANEFGLKSVPSSIWVGVALVSAYLVGSLATVKNSPFGWVLPRTRSTLSEVLAAREAGEEDLGRFPRRHRVAAFLVDSFRPRWLLNRFGASSTTGFSTAERDIDQWVQTKFDAYVDAGRVPVMRSYWIGNPRGGFDGFAASHDVRQADEAQTSLTDDSIPVVWSQELAQAFVREVKSQRPAVETRIQMRFPEVYAEIDRLKVEGELRKSIFWPLVALALSVAYFWSSWVLLFLLVPPLLLADGLRRSDDASSRTWATVVAGEVSAPLIDEVEAAEDSELVPFDPPKSWMDH